MPTRLDTRDLDFDAKFQAFLGAKREVSQDAPKPPRAALLPTWWRGATPRLSN